jgi:hypothetical protein
VVVEFHDKWAVADCRDLSEQSMAKIGQVTAPPVGARSRTAVAAAT